MYMVLLLTGPSTCALLGNLWRSSSTDQTFSAHMHMQYENLYMAQWQLLKLG